MSDFDTRLKDKLEHLDGAIPEPAAPDLGAARALASRRRGRFRRLVPALAAAALLIGAGAVGAETILYPDNPEPELEAALAQAWSGADCMSPSDAEVAAQAALAQVGKTGWQVVARPSVGQGTGCTFAALISTTHEVILLGGAGRELSDALATLRSELFEQCLDRDGAVALVSSVVNSHGVTDFDIVTNPLGMGPAIPLDQVDAYIAHFKEGCFMWGAMGWNEAGKPQFHLAWPWP